MKTASQFAEEISAITADLEPDTEIVPVEDAPLAEEIADWRGPLVDIQVRLRRMIQQDIDKFMESANKILTDAEKSGWSKLAIQNSVKRWSKDVNKVYADFKNSTKGFMVLVKAMGITTRRHSTKGKAPGKSGKMDWGKLSQVQLKKEVRAQIKRLSAGIHSLADDGSFMLHQIDRILKYKQPKDETVREEIGALHQDFVDFRNAFGSKVWAPYNGLMVMRKRPLKSQPNTPQFTQVAHSALPVDCPELREAIERDHVRATNAVMGENQDDATALIGSIEEELLGEAEADKMKAKGYKFKILLKNKPPLYAKTEKGAKDVQKDYPGSKIVVNESEEIDDPACLEAIDTDLYTHFEDFDAMLYGEEEELVESEKAVAKKMKAKGYFYKIVLKAKDGEPLYAKTMQDAIKVHKDNPGSETPVKLEAEEDGEAEGETEPPFPQTEAVEFNKGQRIADGPARQKMVIQQIFGFMRLKGTIEPGPGSKFMHGIVDIPGGRLEFDADRERVAWTAYANGSIIDKGASEYGGSINKMTKPMKVAMAKVAKTEAQGFGRDDLEEARAVVFHKEIRLPTGGKGPFANRLWYNLKIYDKGNSWDVSWSDERGGDHHSEIFKKSDKRGQMWLKPAFDQAGVKMEGQGLSEEKAVDLAKALETELAEMSQVANTIFQQFGGGRAMAMIGGKAMASGSNKLSIKWPNKTRSKGNVVEITYLPGKDLYDMEFFNSTMRAHKSVKKFKGIYADMLVPTFEKQTGWYLHL